MKKISLLLAIVLLMICIPVAALSPIEFNTLSMVDTMEIQTPIFKNVSGTLITDWPAGNFMNIVASVKNNDIIPYDVIFNVYLRDSSNNDIRVGGCKKKLLGDATASITVGMSIPVDPTGYTIFIKADGQEAPSTNIIYVATNGVDTAAGDINNPLKTIAGARDKIRIIKQNTGLPNGGIFVYFRGGDYTFDSTVKFIDLDSGLPNAHITYAEYPGETVRFNGSNKLPGANFVSVTDDAILQRLPVASRSSVKQIDLSALGITEYGSIERGNPWTRELKASTELYVGDELQIIARWPNINGNIPIFTRYGTVTVGTNPNGDTFTYSDNRISNWQDVTNIWVSGFFSWDWYSDSMPITAINTTAKTISLRNKSSYVVLENQRYYAFNILEELDTPGEWYLNRSTGMLYLYPKVGVDLSNSRVTLTKTTQELLNLASTSYIRFTGMSMEDSRFTGMIVNSSNNITVAGVTFRGLGGQAMNVNGSNNIIIQSCDAYDLGRGGFFLEGGDRPTLTSSGIFINNCKIYNADRQIMTGTPAIYVEGCGITVKNNVIHDGTHVAMYLDGNEHLIQGNEFYNFMTITSDTAAIYGGRNWTSRGTMIKNNLFHDIWGLEDRSGNPVVGGGFGIYFDDLMSGNNIEQNIFYDMTCGVYYHGTADSAVNNNIFANSPTSIDERVISRGSGWDRSPHIAGLNAMMSDPRTNVALWYSKYPRLETILSESDNWKPKNNVITKNLLYNSGTGFTPITGYTVNTGIRYSDYATPTLTFSNNVQTFTDPGFVNMAGKNFMLNANSSIFTTIPGFVNIDTSLIGLYIDKYRKTK